MSLEYGDDVERGGPWYQVLYDGEPVDGSPFPTREKAEDAALADPDDEYEIREVSL